MKNPAFFIYNLKTQTNMYLVTNIHNTLTIFSKTKEVIDNAIKFDIQNLQRQCQRCQYFIRE